MITVIYSLMNFVSFLLPIRLAYFMTKVVSGILYFTLYKKSRQNVENNLSYVFADKTGRQEKERMIYETFQSFALFMYEFMIMRKINQKTYKRFVNPVGFENVERALKKGKGVIIITGHLGNWEWGAALLTYLNCKAMVIATKFKNEFVTKLYYNKRKHQGLEVIFLEEAVRKILKKLKSNGIVAIVGDRDYTNQGIEVPFFGKKTKFPTGALLLGLRTGAPVIPCFAIRRGMCRYDVIFKSPLVMKSKGYKENELKKDLMQWVRMLEKFVKEYPEQWYRFEPFWEPENA